MIEEIESEGYYKESSTIYGELKSLLEKVQHSTNQTTTRPLNMQYFINVAVITKFTDIIKSWIIKEYKSISGKSNVLIGDQYISAVLKSWKLFEHIIKALKSIYNTHSNITTQCDMELLSKELFKYHFLDKLKDKIYAEIFEYIDFIRDSTCIPSLSYDTFACFKEMIDAISKLGNGSEFCKLFKTHSVEYYTEKARMWVFTLTITKNTPYIDKVNRHLSP